MTRRARGSERNSIKRNAATAAAAAVAATATAASAAAAAVAVAAATATAAAVAAAARCRQLLLRDANRTVGASTRSSSPRAHHQRFTVDFFLVVTRPDLARHARARSLSWLRALFAGGRKQTIWRDFALPAKRAVGERQASSSVAVNAAERASMRETRRHRKMRARALRRRSIGAPTSAEEAPSRPQDRQKPV